VLRAPPPTLHRAAGAALVVDDHLPPEVLGQHRGQRPRESVGAAAGGKSTISVIGLFGHDCARRLPAPSAAVAAATRKMSRRVG